MPLIRQHSEEHFLVNVLGAKRIHEHRRARLVSFDKRLTLIYLLKQLGSQHSPVDQIDREIGVVQLPFPQLQVARIGYRRRITMCLKELLEQLELSLGRQSPIIHDRDLRLLAAAANALVDCKQRVQHVLPAIHRRDSALKRELAHKRQAAKDLRRYILISDPGRTLGIQLDELISLVSQKGIQPRCNRNFFVARIDGDQFTLPFGQPYLIEHKLIGRRKAADFLDRSPYRLARSRYLLPVASRDEVRPQIGRQHSPAKNESRFAQSLLEKSARLLKQPRLALDQ